MKTAFEKIVDIENIGRAENNISAMDLFSAASAENLPKASEDSEKILFLAVDVQKDFMEGGPLGVSGSIGDVERMTRFIYSNMTKITTIAASIDWHSPQQIFHPCWWSGEDGREPSPFTIITYQDLKDGRWRPVYEPEDSAEYLRYLDESGQKRLCVWPYHCLSGTCGAALENQFSNMIHFFSVARNSELRKIVKGTIRTTEFYGIVKPEYDPDGRFTNIGLLEELRSCAKIVIAGEAKDYCVFETLQQILGALSHEARRPEIFLLEDCSSLIQPKETADALYIALKEKYKIQMVKSTEEFL